MCATHADDTDGARGRWGKRTNQRRERTPSQVKEHRVETIQGEGGGRGDASPPNTPPLPLTHRITHIHACSATLRGRGTSPFEKRKHKRRREYQHGRAAKASRTGERTHARTHTHRGGGVRPRARVCPLVRRILSSLPTDRAPDVTVRGTAETPSVHACAFFSSFGGAPISPAESGR